MSAQLDKCVLKAVRIHCCVSLHLVCVCACHRCDNVVGGWSQPPENCCGCLTLWLAAVTASPVCNVNIINCIHPDLLITRGRAGRCMAGARPAPAPPLIIANIASSESEPGHSCAARSSNGNRDGHKKMPGILSHKWINQRKYFTPQFASQHFVETHTYHRVHDAMNEARDRLCGFIRHS